MLLDADADSKEAVRALGITNGAFVCIEPRTRITVLDTDRHLLFRTFQSAAHTAHIHGKQLFHVGRNGGAAAVPDLLAHRNMLIDPARGRDAALFYVFCIAEPDVYPFYGSDADAALSAGVDARHGLIGPGVYASHGYERSR